MQGPTVMKHITKFKELLGRWDIIDEDTIIQLFMMSLGLGGNEDMDVWYDEIPPGGYIPFEN